MKDVEEQSRVTQAVARAQGPAALGMPDAHVTAVHPVYFEDGGLDPCTAVIDLSGGKQATLLVLDGAVVTTHDDANPRRYLERTGLFARRALDPVTLSSIFTAWGNVPHAIGVLTPSVTGPHDEAAALDWQKDGGAKLTLYSREVPRPSPPQPTGIGPGWAGPRPFRRVTLHVSPSLTFSWELHGWDAQAGKWSPLPLH